MHIFIFFALLCNLHCSWLTEIVTVWERPRCGAWDRNHLAAEEAWEPCGVVTCHVTDNMTELILGVMWDKGYEVRYILTQLFQGLLGRFSLTVASWLEDERRFPGRAGRFCCCAKTWVRERKTVRWSISAHTSYIAGLKEHPKTPLSSIIDQTNISQTHIEGVPFARIKWRFPNGTENRIFPDLLWGLNLTTPEARVTLLKAHNQTFDCLCKALTQNIHPTTIQP